MIHLLLALLLITPQSQGERRPVPIEQELEVSPRIPSASELRIYDISDLTGHDRLGPLLAEVSDESALRDLDGAWDLLQHIEGAQSRAAASIDSVIEMIRERVEPAFDERTQRVQHLDGGKLALLGAPGQHVWLEGFLAGAASFSGVVDLQARIYVLTAELLAGLERVHNGQVLDEREVETLITSLARTEVDMVLAPRVLVFPFQRAELSSLDEVAYVRDFEFKVLPDQDVELADPIIDIARSGLVMELRAVPLASGKLGVYADLDYSTLTQPIPSLKTTIGSTGHEVTIQVPEITRIRVEGHFDLYPDQTLLLLSSDGLRDERVLVLLRVARVEAQKRR